MVYGDDDYYHVNKAEKPEMVCWKINAFDCQPKDMGRWHVLYSTCTSGEFLYAKE